MNAQYFAQYYLLERENWWFKVRAKIILQHLNKIAPSATDLKILNVGAATGNTSVLLQKFGKVTSIEYDKDCYEFTKQKLGIEIYNASATDLPFENNSFDLVCCFDVIEHIENDQLAVNEMNRVCKPNGILFLTVPAFMQLWSTHDEVNHHFRRYTLSQILQLFSQLKGDVIRKTYFCAFLFLPLYVFRKLKNLLTNKKSEKEKTSDFATLKPNGFVDKVLYQIFNVERFLLRYINFPFGSSVLLSWKKEK